MLVIGVTGGVGTGKSTVSKLLAAHGAVVLDADVIAHEAMRPRTAAWRAIVARFGRDILKPNGAINRAALAQRVFRDATSRRALERIIHPRVIRIIRQRIAWLTRSRRASVVVLDVPLLIEAGMRHMVDALVVVTAPARVRQQRLQRRGYTKEDIARRAAAQLRLSAKVGMADYLIDNGKGRSHTRRQVDQLWKQLKKVTRKSRG